MTCIADQLECVTREIQRREEAYPQLVLSGHMTREEAYAEKEAMQDVLATLKGTVE